RYVPPDFVRGGPPPTEPAWMLGDGIVVALAVDRIEQLRFPVGRTVCQQRAIRIARSQGALQLRGGSRIDGPVRFDVVTFGDHRGGVSEEGCGRVGPEATRDHSRPGPPVPPQADPAVSQAGE